LFCAIFSYLLYTKYRIENRRYFAKSNRNPDIESSLRPNIRFGTEIKMAEVSAMFFLAVFHFFLLSSAITFVIIL